MICPQIDTTSFLRALQLHIFKWGVPSLILADNGSPIVSGVNQMISFWEDPDTLAFLEEKYIRRLEFRPYPANGSKLGGLVESLVKQVKNLISSSIRNNILTYFDYEFLIAEATMLINKRPIAFKTALTKWNKDDCVIAPLTPEMILHGYEIPSINIIPQLSNETIDENDNAWEQTDEVLDKNSQKIFQRYEQLKRVKNKLENLYQTEFIFKLFDQAVDRKNRYSKQTHIPLAVGDLVSIKTKNLKPFNYPLAIVIETETNDIGEIVSAKLKKSNGEIVRRHSNDLIFLSKTSLEFSDSDSKNLEDSNNINNKTNDKPKRKSALTCSEKNKDLAANDLI